MTQASRFEGLLFDPFLLLQNDLVPSEVDVSRCDVVEAPVVALMVVVIDEGFKRQICKNAKAVRQAIKEAFTQADLYPFIPHAFRRTLLKWADTAYPTCEAFKAFSQNIGYTSVITTVSASCPVSIERQSELMMKTAK